MEGMGKSVPRLSRKSPNFTEIFAICNGGRGLWGCWPPGCCAGADGPSALRHAEAPARREVTEDISRGVRGGRGVVLHAESAEPLRNATVSVEYLCYSCHGCGADGPSVLRHVETMA